MKALLIALIGAQRKTDTSFGTGTVIDCTPGGDDWQRTEIETVAKDAWLPEVGVS